MASPMRLNPVLVAAAEREAAINKRSVPKQIEFWAELGRMVERVMALNDVLAVIQGLKKIRVEPVTSVTLDPTEVFNSLEKRRKNGTISEKVTSSTMYYEASPGRPGLLDKINTATGERQTGRFQNGEFKPVR